MFPITITLNTQAQLNAVMRALATDAPAPEADTSTAELVAGLQAKNALKEAAAPTGKSSGATPARGQRTAAAEAQAPVTPEKTAAAPASSAAASAEPQPQASTAADAPITYDQVRPLILEVVKKKGRPAGESLLSKFGAKNGTELKPADYATFVAQANELLAA